MKNLLRNRRIEKKLKTKDVAQALGIDQALISKFENGTRKPTKEHLFKLAEILDIAYETLLVAWLKDKIYAEIGTDQFVYEAILQVKEEMAFYASFKRAPLSKKLERILKEIDTLKNELNQFRKYDSFRISQALELEYTFESNKIEGNTLTLKETDLIVNEGLTISGKSMREHLEAINHQEAIAYIKELMDKNTAINEREILCIHNLILRGIYPEDAGKYRKVQVMIKGSSHMPPQPFLVAKEMEELFIWYQTNKNNLHPVILAAEMHERLVTIHPFIDGNGRTSRLLMNLILLQHGYVIANIKGTHESRMSYYNALEACQVENNKEHFLLLIAQTEKECLERYLSIIKPN
jgi:Fic family protein/DNA-binding XRE family transcriptional regulator|nr:Fic family protein [uncultured Flavobacterium sp.]